MLRRFIVAGFSLSAALYAADSKLADAVMQGDKTGARELLKAKADVNAAQGDGMTPLHWAAFRDDLDSAKLLLAGGASVKATTRINALTPLTMAAQNGSAAMIELLTKAGADVNAATGTGATPLMMAATSGSVDAVKALLEHGANVNAKETAHGQTALMFAAAEDRGAVIRLLISKGADAKIATPVVRLGRSVYDDDAANDATRLAAEAEAKKAAAARAAEAKAAGKAPADPDPNKIEITADRGGGLQAITIAQGPGGRAKNVAAVVMGGLNALCYAARDGKMEAVKALVEAGADVNQVTAGDKSSPMVLAASNGHYPVVKYLLDHGADPNLANIDGLAPLYAVVDMRYAALGWVPDVKTDQEEAQYSSLALLADLLHKGADVNKRLRKKLWFRLTTHDTQWVDTAGATAFWRASQSSDVEAMKVLWEVGKADTNLASAEGDTPLIVATGLGWAAGQSQNAPNSWLKAVKYLVEDLHADVNAKDIYTYTPLSGAAFRGDNEMVQFLVDHGAGPSLLVKSKRGQAVTDMANGQIVNADLPVEHPDTVALLEKMGAPKPSVFGPNHK